MEPCRIDILTFALDGVRFALPRQDIVEIMPVEPERWVKLARMAERGTLGATGLPLLHLSARLGIAVVAPSERSALLLIGEAGRPRGVVLIDSEPFLADAECAPIAASLVDPADARDLIVGTARLPDGLRAILLQIPIGITDERARHPRVATADSYLLVRLSEGREVCAAPVSALRGSDRPHRLLVAGAHGVAVPIAAVEGPAPTGHVERIAGALQLVTASGIYRLLGEHANDDAVAPGTGAPARLLIVAPQSESCTRMRTIARELGYEVSLADDPRAAELARRSFDVVLVDLDACGINAPACGGARLVGVTRRMLRGPVSGFETLVAADDEVALIAALLPRQSRAA